MNNRKQSKSRDTLYWIVGAIVLLALIVSGFVIANSSNKAQIIESPATQVKRGPEFLTLDSQYLSFSYNSMYQAIKLSEQGSAKEMYMLTADTSYEKHLAVAIYDDPAGLEDLSSYMMRKVQPALYSRKDMPLAGETATIFTKNDGSEETVFVKKGRLITILSFTTAGQHDVLDPEVLRLLQTYNWK